MQQRVELIKKHIANAPAEDDAEGAVENHVFYFLSCFGGGQADGGAAHRQPPNQEETEQIHHAVPAYGEWTELDDDGINGREGEHQVTEKMWASKECGVQA